MCLNVVNSRKDTKNPPNLQKIFREVGGKEYQRVTRMGQRTATEMVRRVPSASLTVTR